MKVTRLSWPGLMMETDSTTLYIDPLQNVADMLPFLGAPRTAIFPVPFPKTGVANALITHIHLDHFDQAFLPVLLKDGGKLWGPEPVSKVATQNGLNAAFLPVNGVVGAVPGLEIASEMYGTMTPAQAVTATRILKAGMLVPMHYGVFYNPPLYNQFPDLDNELDQEGEKQRIEIRRLSDGESIEF